MKTKDFINTPETAKLIRKALKSAFPSIKFSVRSKQYSGGSSIGVSWADGPTDSQVEAVAKHYQGGSFDSMTDCMNYHESVLVDASGTPRLVSFGADFVFCDRQVSPENKALVLAATCQKWGINEAVTLNQYGAYPDSPLVANDFLSRKCWAEERKIDFRKPFALVQD